MVAWLVVGDTGCGGTCGGGLWFWREGKIYWFTSILCGGVLDGGGILAGACGLVVVGGT